MGDIIEPRTLRGFRDSLPEAELAKEEIQERLAHRFRAFGFVPIDTPALEYAEILLGKGGGETDKQVYRFLDHGQRDVALRFDLTVPFARFMAAHSRELTLPFKRYHMAKVWRGENTQRGRYREFIQIDFDIVGVDSAGADLEILLVMQDSLASLGIEEFTIHLFHRQLFNELLGMLGLEDRLGEVLRTVDRLPKIGAEEVRRQLTEIAGEDRAARVLHFIERGSSDEETLEQIAAAVPPDSGALRRLRTLRAALHDRGLGAAFRVDPSITRGLDYYTGIVCETFLTALPGIGSVCSGGRYNDLAGLYTKQRLPGVGASIGLDRLLAALEELGVGRAARPAPDLLVVCMEEALLGLYHRLAGELRRGGLSVDVYPEEKKLAAQLRYAEKRGIPLALFCGEEEKRRGRYNLKDLRTRRSFEALTIQEAADTAAELLRS